jgi:uncharacterized FAD-dependent dehydrogenase
MLEPEIKELLETARMAVEQIKLYDKRLVQMGEPPEKVYSDIHKQGILKADQVIQKWDWEDSKCVSNTDDPPALKESE